MVGKYLAFRNKNDFLFNILRTARQKVRSSDVVLTYTKLRRYDIEGLSKHQFASTKSEGHLCCHVLDHRFHIFVR